MTLVAAWIRDAGPTGQLIVAADSRLSFGARWDCCPKIFPLPRNDSVLAFCGDTTFAYPILLQLINAIGNYEKALSRELDITDLRPHFIKVIESMRSQVTGLPKGDHRRESSDFTFMFAGYSSKQQKFKAWSLHYDKAKGSFNHRPLSFHSKRSGGTKPLLFIGDHVPDALLRVFLKLKERGRLTVGGLDMEPLEVLTEMCEAREYDKIGGPPPIGQSLFICQCTSH